MVKRIKHRFHTRGLLVWTCDDGPDKYGCSGYGIGWTIVHQIIMIKTKYILILGEGPTDGLDNTAMTEEAKYYINLT